MTEVTYTNTHLHTKTPFSRLITDWNSEACKISGLQLDELYGDRTSYEELLRKEREAHDLEVSTLKAEMASKERQLSESKTRIEFLEKELAESKSANVDANHKVDSTN